MFKKILLTILAISIAWGGLHFWPQKVTLGPKEPLLGSGGFSWYKQMTLAAAQAGTADSTNYPLAIALDGNVQAADADLKTVGNGGFVQNSNGYDIRPYSDSALTSALVYQLVYYDATTGKLEMHVKIPTLSHTSNTIIYLAFGDATISTDGSSSTTWDTNFVGVYHMKDGTTLSVADSSQSGNNGTNVGVATATAGEIDGAANLVASSVQYVDAGNNSSFDFTTGFTLSAWINVTSLADLNYAIWKGDTTAVSPNFGNLYNLVVLSSGKVETLMTNSTRANIYAKDSTTTLSTGTWYLISSAFDASTNSLYVLINGAVEGAAVTTSGNQATSTSAVQFGADHSGAGSYTNYANAKIDETRLSNIARSASWLLSDYNSQKPSSTFIAWGAKTPTGGGTPTPIPRHRRINEESVFIDPKRA